LEFKIHILLFADYLFHMTPIRLTHHDLQSLKLYITHCNKVQVIAAIPLHFLGAVRASNIHTPQHQKPDIASHKQWNGQECNQIMKLCRLETFPLEKQCPAMWVAKLYYSNNTLLSLCLNLRDAIAKNVCSIGPLCPQVFCNSSWTTKL